MKEVSNLVFRDQIVMVTSILLVMYVMAVVPRAFRLVKAISNTKSLFKKTLYWLFFLISLVADLTVITLAIHGIVYFLRS